MKATLTIVLNEVAALTATADFPDVGVRTLVEYDSRLEPWFEKTWRVAPHPEGAAAVQAAVDPPAARR